MANCVDMGLTDSSKGIKHLESISDLCCLDLYLFVLNFTQPSGKKQLEICLIVVRQELFERKPAVYFCFIIQGKGPSATGLILNTGGKFI